MVSWLFERNLESRQTVLLSTLSVLALYLANKVSPAPFLFQCYHNTIVCYFMTAVVDSTLPALDCLSAPAFSTIYHINIGLNIYTAMDAGMEIPTDNQNSEHEELI